MMNMLLATSHKIKCDFFFFVFFFLTALIMSVLFMVILPIPCCEDGQDYQFHN